MAELGHDGDRQLCGDGLVAGGNQPDASVRLGNRKRACALPSERNGDLEGPRFLVQSHRRQGRDAVRKEHPSKVDHLAGGAAQREFTAPGAPTLPSPRGRGR